MGFHRAEAPEKHLAGAALTSDMAGIGMNFAAPPNPEARIEETLLAAAWAGMQEHDLRVLSLLARWLEVHHRYVHTERLARALRAEREARVRAWWAAVGCQASLERRWARLASLYQGPPLDLLPVGTDFQLARRGPDPRFEGGPLRVPAGTLRSREGDVMTPAALAAQHRGYRNRVQMGPSWRAEVWTLLEQHPDLTTAQLARRAGCAFSTAWEVAQDFAALRSPARAR
jgi:hypothetical protein